MKFGYFIVLLLIPSCRESQSDSSLKVSIPYSGRVFKPDFKPVQYPVPQKQCLNVKLTYPNARAVEKVIESKKVVLPLKDAFDRTLEPPANASIAWTDMVADQIWTLKAPADHQEALQNISKFRDNGACPAGDLYCELKAKTMDIKDLPLQVHFDRALTYRYGSNFKSGKYADFRKNLYISLGKPKEVLENGKKIAVVLDYEKWVWTNEQQTLVNRPFTSAAIFSATIITEQRTRGLNGRFFPQELNWLKGLFRAWVPSLMPGSRDFWADSAIYEKYANRERGGTDFLGKEFNTTFKPFELSQEVKEFYKNFNPDRVTRAKEIRAHLQNWLLNSFNKVSSHVWGGPIDEVAGWERVLKEFLVSVPSYKGDLYLPTKRGNRDFANQFMLNVAAIKARPDGRFRLEQLLPGLQPDRLIMGDLDPLIAGEGTGFTQSPENLGRLKEDQGKSLASHARFYDDDDFKAFKASQGNYIDMQKEIFHPFQSYLHRDIFYGIMVRVKSDNIKVTYPLYRANSQFDYVQRYWSDFWREWQYGAYLPKYAFTGFIQDDPNELYEIEKIEQINPDISPRFDPRGVNSTEVPTSYSFDVLITIKKAGMQSQGSN